MFSLDLLVSTDELALFDEDLAPISRAAFCVARYGDRLLAHLPAELVIVSYHAPINSENKEFRDKAGNISAV
jgi:ABC-type transport system involved in cytochrome c biogenesis ATPase subunit